MPPETDNKKVETKTPEAPKPEKKDRKPTIGRMVIATIAWQGKLEQRPAIVVASLAGGVIRAQVLHDGDPGACGGVELRKLTLDADGETADSWAWPDIS